MYTAYIGRRILDLHNAQTNQARTPRQFFDEVFFPLFFDDERYLMWVNNSPFDQAYKLKLKVPLTPDVRRQRLAEVHAKASALQEQDGSILLGSAALGVEASTSSQVTDISVPVSAEEVYLSWIGAAAGVGVEGGFSLLIDDDRVLLAIVQGWSEYRRYMSGTPHLKSHQIDTWNGWWLQHRFGPNYEPEQSLNRLPKAASIAGSSSIALSTVAWVRVMFALARERPERAIAAYVYTFGNTNKTIGFIQLNLPRIGALRPLFARLFGSEVASLNPDEIETLYETEFSFMQACRQGSIGLHALEPRKLRQYMPTGRGESKLPKPPSNEEAFITFAIYQTWIIAMLSNNEKLLDLAESSAQALHSHAASGTRAKATPKRLIENTLEAGSRRKFIEGLTEMIQNDDTHADQFDQLVHEIVKMPASDFPLLLTLIKFKYALASRRA